MTEQNMTNEVTIDRSNVKEITFSFVHANISVIARFLMNDGRSKKAFLKEYKSKAHVYEKAAKAILSPEFNIADIVCMPYNVRADAVRVCAVVYRLIFDEHNVTGFFDLMGQNAEYKRFVEIFCDCNDAVAQQKAARNSKNFPPQIVILYVLNEFLHNDSLTEAARNQRLAFMKRILRTYLVDSCPDSDEMVRHFLDNSNLALDRKSLAELYHQARDSAESDSCALTGCECFDAMWTPINNIILPLETACLSNGYSLNSIISDFVVTKQRLMDAANFAYEALRIYNSVEDTLFSEVSECMEREEWNSEVDIKAQMVFDENVLLWLFCAALSTRFTAEVKRQISQELFQKVKSTTLPDSTASKMQGKIDELKKQVEKLEHDKNAIEATLFSARKRENALKSKLADAENVLKQIRAQKLDSDLKRESEAEAPDIGKSDDAASVDSKAETTVEPVAEVDYCAELDKMLEQYKVCIVGGNTNLVKKFRSKHSNGIYIGREKEGSCDQTIRGSDVVLFKFESCGHSLYDKCKSIAQRAGIPYGYIDDVASVNLLERDIYCKLTQLLAE